MKLSEFLGHAKIMDEQNVEMNLKFRQQKD